MEIFIAGIVGIVIGFYLYRTISKAKLFDSESEIPATASSAREVVLEVAGQLENFYQTSAYPAQILEQPDFQKGVRILCSDHFSPSQLLETSTDPNVIIGCMALEALRQRHDDIDVLETFLENLNDNSFWKRFFILRLLDTKIDSPLVGKVLFRGDLLWSETLPLQILKDFITVRIEKGETPQLAQELNTVTEERINILKSNLNALGEKLNRPLFAELNHWEQTRINMNFFKAIGRVWDEQEFRKDRELLIEHEQLSATVVALENALSDSLPRSIVLVGESGVGKTAIARILSYRLRKKGWFIFEAGALDLLAGQVFIGQLEERIQKLIRNISGKRKVLWMVPKFHELMWAGTHQYSGSSILDMIFPFVENGQITLLGESQPNAFDRLLQHNSRILTATEVVRVNPLSPEATLELARAWITRRSTQSLLSDETLQEAFQLTNQYLGDKASPGNLLQLLDLTWRQLAGGNGVPAREITVDDLLVTLSRLTGLPISILDDRQGLDLQALRDLFQKRVLGQPEAVTCLVERVAMIKAGLTDPTRPQGVFLFAGPTGTGKTEIAKTLAEFLFGSSRRMIRLDMSEFQSPASLDRILGEPGSARHSRGEALVNLVRKQPFSVMLLDEFEKASPEVWDVFLQVFDDGRLTDSLGGTADFRHSIIIMTTNLGGVIPRGVSIGFTTRGAGFTARNVSRAIETAFRKEFLNRVDRVVVFQPLSRSVMREILQKELQEVLQRRGLRSRNWAVEWHESAIEFLLEQGFTVDLGARPLKRAIERYLLSPLSLTIVNHQFPEGDQFLFVRSKGRKIEVEFIDPDAPEGAAQTGEPAAAGQAEAVKKEIAGLPQVILEARGTPPEVLFLQETFQQLSSHVQSSEWGEKKQQALAQTSIPEFWESPERFSVLGLVEYMDRIETGFRTAERLLERLVGPRGERQHFSATLLQRLAHQLYLLDAAVDGLRAGLPQDAFLLVKAGRDPAVTNEINDDVARKIGQMYQQWSEKRRMRHQILEEVQGNSETPYHLLLAIGGYAAYAILKKERGLHVFEIPASGKAFQRAKVYVEVAPQPEEPAGHEPDALLRQSEEAFARSGSAGKLTIVRRYREAPSPLVRNGIRNWRSGRLDLVLGGDFDLIGS